MGFLDPIADAVDAVASAASDVVSAVPGGDALSGALRDLANGPLRDFANTAVGRVVLQAVASAFYGSIAWTVGPQLASIAFAVPGLAQGDDLTTAYLQGVKTRAEQTAQIVGGPLLGNMFGNDLVRALKDLAQEYGPDDVIAETAERIAARLDVRLDAAAFARAVWNRLPLPDPASFDLLGNRMPYGLKSGIGLTVPSAVSRSIARTPAYGTTATAAITRASAAARLLQSTSAPIAAGPVERAASVATESTTSPVLVALGVLGAVVGVGAIAWFAAASKD